MFIREIISEGEVIQGNFPSPPSPPSNDKFELHAFTPVGAAKPESWVDDNIKDKNELSKKISELMGPPYNFKAENIKVMMNNTFIAMPEFGITNEGIDENLRAWFGKGKKGGAGGGGWDRYNTKGERIGKCGDAKKGEGKPKCLSKSKAASLRSSGGKAAIGKAVSKKRRNDPNKNRKGKAKNVSNTVGKKK